MPLLSTRRVAAALKLPHIRPSKRDVELAQRTLWEAGDLDWLLDPNQREMRANIIKGTDKYYVVECARRLGKSYMLCVMAVEAAMQGQFVLYAAPTSKDAQEIVAPLLQQILDTAPFKPRYDKVLGKWRFPGGGQIRLFACDNKTKANRGRGSTSHLVLVDEAGFIPVLDYVLHSIVGPQTLTTRGRIVLASTPSDEPDHPFTTIAQKAEEQGFYVRKTVYDNPRLTPEDIEEYIRDDAAVLGYSPEEFKATDVFKREFLALRAIDTNLVVMPDWNGRASEEDRPEFFDAYVAFDAGGIDPHGLLFGYWDFAKEQLVIEDELLLRDNETTQQIVTLVKSKEMELWGVDKWDGTLRANEKNTLVQSTSRAQPYLRVCDLGSGKLQLTIDGVSFLPTPKSDKLKWVDAARVLFRQDKIRIHPRCKHLMRQLRVTMWKDVHQNDYRRTKDGQHGDLIDCLVYMVRNLRRTKNPSPPGWGIPTGADVWVRPKKDQPSLLPAWRKYM